MNSQELESTEIRFDEAREPLLSTTAITHGLLETPHFLDRTPSYPAAPYDFEATGRLDPTPKALDRSAHAQSSVPMTERREASRSPLVRFVEFCRLLILASELGGQIELASPEARRRAALGWLLGPRRLV
jgi:hypothetical protein